MSKDMSIVVTTYNRPKFVRRLIKSLETSYGQMNPHAKVELILVDASEKPKPVNSSKIQIKYISRPKVSASEGRNIGIDIAKGKFVCFLDDDVIVTKLYLSRVWNFFLHESQKYDGYIGASFSCKKNAIRGMRKNRTEMIIDKPWHAIFYCAGNNWGIKREKLDLRFDPKLGPGTKNLAAEDMDILYRLLKKGRVFKVEPSLKIRHENKYQTDGYYEYAVGFGAFVKKNMDSCIALIVLVSFLLKQFLSLAPNSRKKEKILGFLKGLWHS